ncbi:hypothetical protein OB955_05540 [Halobacteria archaeon AArc-m2/3/4]|uniref:Uncharacterized protein n=1 Tax=Natronoglomus mannanivorans TaxID=2979990 RepID=A0AAP2Z255_9EURY|nr:hypothetical protein [Halobacteria archaeon AArc-xg1-1]MCU4972196.1 hypothetical protein [Halobacteria archaeon AArc-m2/3/4]
MYEYTTIIALANTATLVTGGLVMLFAHRAFRRTGATPLRAVAIGFGFIVAGSVLGGLVHLAGDVALGIAVQSSFTAGGFAALLYSLYSKTPRTTTVRTRVTK